MPKPKSKDSKKESKRQFPKPNADHSSLVRINVMVKTTDPDPSKVYKEMQRLMYLAFNPDSYAMEVSYD